MWTKPCCSTKLLNNEKKMLISLWNVRQKQFQPKCSVGPMLNTKRLTSRKGNCRFLSVSFNPRKTGIKHFWSQVVHKIILRHWKALSARIHKRASIRVYGSKSAQKSYKMTGLSDGRQSAGVGARYRTAGNLSLKKPPKTVRHGLPFPFERPILVASF